MTIPAEFRAALEAELAQLEDADRIKTRNHGEAFRQYLTCVLRKLDETILTTKGEARGKPRYANADELIACSAHSRAGADREPQPLAGQ